MAVDVLTLLKLAPLATHQLKRYRRSNRSKSLDRRVQAELENDAALGPGTTESLQNEWFHLHNDPRAAVLIAGLLFHGEVTYLDALRVRAGEVLEGLEMLPLGVEGTVDRLIEAVSNNFVAAQRDDAEATQAGTSAVLSAISPLATSEEVQEGLAELKRDLTPPPPRVLILASSFDENQQRHLDGLIAKDSQAAGRLGELLGAGETNRLAQVVRSPPAWASEQPATFWQAAGRILVDAGRLADAEQAFVREANTPDVEDRPAALVNAARCAEADGWPNSRAAADEHLAAATAAQDDHPMVELFTAGRAEDPEERLALTDAVRVQDDRQLARKEVQRALALLGLQRYDEAHAAATASTTAYEHGGGREIATLATILKSSQALPMRDRDDRPLMDAVAYQLSLHQEARDTGRTGMAGVAGARAALGAAVLGDQSAARELIDTITADETLLVEEEARSTLFNASMAIGDAGRARALLGPEDDTPEWRLKHATLEVIEGAEGAEAVAALDALLEELPPGDLRTEAAVIRVLAAHDPAVSLDPSLVDGIDGGERLLAHAQATRAIAEDDFTAARAALLAYDDPVSLSLRSEIAERENALPEAIGVQATLTRKQPTPGNLLRLASLRARAGDFPGAIRDALRLATDDRKLGSAREQAYAMAAQAAIEGGQFEELEDISDRWAELSPERKDPLWAHTFALARQNRHDEALAFARRAGLEPVEEADRHIIWAELLMYGEADGAGRMRALMELSDQFGRPLELEQAFIGGVLKTAASERGDEDPEVIARFQESMTTFEERFPGSNTIKAIAVDPEEDGADLISKLASVQSPSTQEQVDARQDAIDGLRQGRMPVAVVAAMVHRGTAETVVRNGAHPLGVFDRPTAEAELAAAGQALDQAAASWDETACITVAQLADEHAQRIDALLPGSRIGQSVRDALADDIRGQMAGEPVAVMQVLPDGTPRIVEENPAVVARVREVQTRTDEAANRLTVTPDPPAADGDELAAVLAREERNGPIAALVSAFLTAREDDLPVFSDDRVVRAYARSLQLPAFGTIALIEAARQRGQIDGVEAQGMLEAVIDLGVWGVALASDGYVAAARRADFDLDRCARPLLSDEALLRADGRILENARLLAAVAGEAPDRLDGWAEMIVRGYQELLELDPLLVTSLLMAAQLDPKREDLSDDMRARNMAIVHALRAAVGFDPTVAESDPLVAGVRRWLHTVEAADERAAALEVLLGQVDKEAAAMLRRTLDTDDGNTS